MNQVNQEQQVHQPNHLKHASQQAGPTLTNESAELSESSGK